MAKKHVLAVCVYVDGKPYGPGEVSAAVAKKITNDKVWASADAEPEQEPASEQGPEVESTEDADAGDADES